MNIRTKLDDYLWKVVCEDFDEEFAYEYLKTNGDFPAAACSSIRKGNLWGRNFDYPYNNSVKFMVKNDRTEDRYASHGSAGGFSTLTKAFVESGEDSDLYKVLPYMVYDGQNEYGVTANYNIVPTDHGVNYVTAKVSEEKEIPALAIIRFILDNFKSATQAVEYIRDHVSLYFSTTLHTQGNELHVMVGDKYKTYCLEFIDGETVVIDISSKPYMTNYHLYGVKFNPDGKVFTPETKLAYDTTKNAYDFNHVTLHGSGLERYNLIIDMYPLIHNEHDMRMALKDLYYTRAYQSSENPANPVWYTEFVGDSLTVKSDVSDFVSAVEAAAEAYTERSRDTGLTWCTCTSVVYDLNALTMVILSQEGDVCHVDTIKPVEDYIYGDVEFKAAQGMTPQGFRVKTKDKIPAVSDIEINPEDEATEELRKIKKDGVTYSVPESGEELPEYTAKDKNKVLSVLVEGDTLELNKPYKLKKNLRVPQIVKDCILAESTSALKFFENREDGSPSLVIFNEDYPSGNIFSVSYANSQSSDILVKMYIDSPTDEPYGELPVNVWLKITETEGVESHELLPDEEIPTMTFTDPFITTFGDDPVVSDISIGDLLVMYEVASAMGLSWEKAGVPKPTVADVGKVLGVTVNKGHLELNKPYKFSKNLRIPQRVKDFMVTSRSAIKISETLESDSPSMLIRGDDGQSEPIFVLMYIRDMEAVGDDVIMYIDSPTDEPYDGMAVNAWIKVPTSGGSYELLPDEEIPTMTFVNRIVTTVDGSLITDIKLDDVSILFGLGDSVSSEWKSGETGISVIEVTETMQTSTLPAQTVPALTKAQIENIRALRAAGKSVRIKNASGDYDVTEGDVTNDEIRFTYFGLYLGYYIEGDNVIAVYDTIGESKIYMHKLYVTNVGENIDFDLIVYSSRSEQFGKDDLAEIQAMPAAILYHANGFGLALFTSKESGINLQGVLDNDGVPTVINDDYSYSDLIVRDTVTTL